MSIGKTITTYLIDGNPQGIKSVFMSNRICQCLAIPRGLLKETDNRSELKRPSLYLLLGDENLAYIGETENFLKRIKDHNYNKDFWNEVIVFSTKDESLNKADVQYLEYLAIQQAKKAKIYNLNENKTSPAEPSMPEHQRDTVIEFFQDVQILSSFLGYRLFEERKQQPNRPLYHCNNNTGTNATGIYEGKGFRVLAGSQLRKKTAPSFEQGVGRKKKLLSENATEEDHYFVLNKDIIFSSPSAASSFCLGANSNGWNDWKDETGQTLNDVIRQKI